MLFLLLPLMVKGQTDSIAVIEKETTMKEVKIKASRILMVQRGDTMVYNADALRLSAGAMLDALINNLPNTEINADGLIIVKGEPVSSLLIEGRDFFHGDPTIALKNLPAFTVNKVKVYRRVPRDAYLSREDKGRKALDTDPLVMDVKLKAKYQDGIIANVESADGLPTKGETKYLFLKRLFGLHYNPRQSLSGYLGVNNINDLGRPQSKGAWKNHADNIGTQSLEIGGADYTYTNTENKLTLNGMFKIVGSQQDIMVEHSDMSYLTNRNLYTVSATKASKKKISAEWSGNLFFPAKYFTIDIKPIVKLSRNKDRTHLLKASFSDIPKGDITSILNRIYSIEDSLIKDSNLINSQAIEKIWQIKGLELSLVGKSTIRPASFRTPLYVTIIANYSSNKKVGDDENNVNYFRIAHENDRRKQHDMSSTGTTNLSIDLKYMAWTFASENRRGELMFNYRSEWNDENRENWLYNLEQAMGSVPEFVWGFPDNTKTKSLMDLNNSYISEERKCRQTVNANVSYNFNSSVGLALGLPIEYLYQWTSDLRYQSHVNLHRSEWILNPNISFNMKGLSFGYNLKTDLPAMQDLISRTDDSDPLFIKKGNSELRRSYTHNPSIAYSTRLGKQAMLNLHSDIQIHKNAIKRMFYSDPETGVITSQTRNVDGDWDFSLRGRYNQILGTKQNWHIDTNLHFIISNDNEFDTNSSEQKLYSAHRLYSVGKIDLSYKKGGWIINFFGEYQWRHTRSIQNNFSNLNYCYLQCGIGLRTPSFKGFSLSTDCVLGSNQGASNAKLNRCYVIWDASINYDLSAKWSFQFEAKDLLQQQTSTSMGGGAFGWSETWRDTRPSYCMLHVQYRFNLLPK